MVIALHLHCRGPEIDTRFAYIFYFFKRSELESKMDSRTHSPSSLLNLPIIYIQNELKQL